MEGSRRKPWCIGLLALVLACWMLTTSCAPVTEDHSVSESTVQNMGEIPEGSGAEGIAKQDPQMDQRMRDLSDQIFSDSARESSLTLHYILAYPENYGITDYEISFGDPLSYLDQEAYDTLEEYREELEEIDPDLLSEDQRVMYDILRVYLDTELSGKEFYLYDQPFSGTGGLQTQLPFILAEYVFYEKKDVEEYLELLEQIDEYYGQLLLWEKKRFEAGLYMTDQEIDHIVESSRPYGDAPEQGFLSDTFQKRLENVPGLSAEEKERYIAQNRKILQEDFTRAYELLEEELPAFKGNRKEASGLASLPRGREYYWYLLKSSTYTTYETPKELEKAIIRQMSDDASTVTAILKSRPELEKAMTDYTFALTEPGPVLEDLKEKIGEEFPAVPECRYHISYVPEQLEEFMSPAFYLTSPLDQYEENAIYINKGDTSPEEDLYSTLAHEGYPGHMYQNVYFAARGEDKLRYMLPFSAYSEGWAFYVEQFAYGWDEDTSEKLAKLLSHNSTSNLALHALLDYYINYAGWSVEDVSDFLFGYDQETIELVYDVIAENPGDYMEYYLGYLEIINMKKKAQKELGEDFDLKAFHTFLLDFGPAPFQVIQDYLEVWIREQSAQQKGR